MKSSLRIRLGAVFVGFALFFGLVIARLVQLQILRNADLTQLAIRQFQKVDRKAPYRYAILDRNGEELAVSVPASSIFVRPRLIRGRVYTARKLAEVLGGKPESYLEKFRSDRPFVWVQRQVDESLAVQLRKTHLPGVFIEAENKRFYPNGTLASVVLGSADIDGNGISGLELTLNDQLTTDGQPLSFIKDGKGNPTYIESRTLAAQRSKRAVRTTLDRRIQHVVEEELSTAIRESHAKGAFAVVLDPHTGEIFALGQKSHNEKDRSSNKVVSDLFEPGSVVKPLLLADAVDRKLYSAQSTIDCENGQFKVGKTRIREAESSHRFKKLGLRKVILHSSNIGAAKIALRMGADGVKNALEKFGLHARTGVELPGEASGKFREKWDALTVANVGFGQGISVTPLQMTSAYSVFATEGHWIAPHLLPIAESGTLEIPAGRRVLSRNTIRWMKDALKSVVSDPEGTGASAQIPGIDVAGKTGTAQKYVAGKGYDAKLYLSSFIGFLPADQPELLIGVFIDEPGVHYYAAKVAAPVFRRIAERSLQILDRLPKKNLQGAERRVASRPSEVITPELHKTEAGWVMPDLRGLSTREALGLMGKYFDNITMVGTGYVHRQSPEPGSALASESPVTLYFSPQGVAPALKPQRSSTPITKPGTEGE